MHANDDYDELYVEDPNTNQVNWIAVHFRGAVCRPDEEVPDAISEAAYSLSRVGRFQLSPKDQADLRYAIFTAADHACARFPADFSRVTIRLGFRAFADQVDYWAETPEQRKRWGNRHLDTEAMARIFRNECHNLVLKTEMEARARLRVENIVRVSRGDGADNAVANEGSPK